MSEVRPNDPAYFTGNSKYYQKLLQLNKLLRDHSIDFQSKPAKTNMQWMSKTNMIEDLGFRLNYEMYNDFRNRLNLLYPQTTKEVKEFLSEFVPLGKSLEKQQKTEIELDEHSRSYTLASRKTAKAQVWLVKGEGKVYVNGLPLDEFFEEYRDREKIVFPFELSQSLLKYNTWAVVEGGGKSSKADAIATAVARGLVIHDGTLVDALDNAGLTTIDRRQVEKKKTGQPKARKKNTWVKR